MNFVYRSIDANIYVFTINLATPSGLLTIKKVSRFSSFVVCAQREHSKTLISYRGRKLDIR